MTAAAEPTPSHERPPGPAGRIAFVAAVAALVLGATAVVIAATGHDASAIVHTVSGVAFAVVGIVVVRKRPEHRLGWLFCAVALLMGIGVAAHEYARRALVLSPGSLPAGTFAAWLVDLIALPMTGLLAGVLPQLFPTGRPISRRWRVPLWGAVCFIAAGAVGNAFYPQRLESIPSLSNPYAVDGAKVVLTALIQLAALGGLAALAGGVAALFVRWRRSQGEERQQLKWFLAGVVLLPIPLLLHDVARGPSNVAMGVLYAVIPVTMGIAIVRYRLYDLDLVVNRTIVYTVVTALVAAVYLAVVGIGEWTVTGSVPLSLHVLAAVVAAAALQPLRSRVQTGVDRIFYGDRSRPYEAVARLGRRLEHALDPDTVLPGVVETVTEALRVPYAAIEVPEGDVWHCAAEVGRRAGGETSFPMVYQGVVVGRLVVGARGPGERFSEADRRLLEDLARHAGVAARAVQTTVALQRSRSELVAAREEERRRLRRDLHDGLGPTLAGVTLGLHAARVQIPSDPESADALLAEIETQIEETIADVRRLVYGLRPPALDEFGLVRSVQLYASRLESDAGLHVRVDAPAEGLGALPAAVEVAAYRIATEALTNVARHAAARACTVRFALNGALDLEVVDDGHGVIAQAARGVGLTAMRERADELGGWLAVESGPSGTRVHAHLPAGPGT